MLVAVGPQVEVEFWVFFVGSPGQSDVKPMFAGASCVQSASTAVLSVAAGVSVATGLVVARGVARGVAVAVGAVVGVAVGAAVGEEVAASVGAADWLASGQPLP